MKRFVSRMLGLAAVSFFGMSGPGTAWAQDAEEELGWADTAELTVVFTGGNAKASTLGFRNELAREWEGATLVTSVGALRAESTTFTRTAVGVSPTSFEMTKDSVTALTAESYYARGQYDRELNARTFWYAGTGWERNTFAGIANRYSWGGGVGNTWVDDDRSTFRTNYGVTYTLQDDVTKVAGGDDTFRGSSPLIRLPPAAHAEHRIHQRAGRRREPGGDGRSSRRSHERRRGQYEQSTGTEGELANAVRPPALACGPTSHSADQRAHRHHRPRRVGKRRQLRHLCACRDLLTQVKVSPGRSVSGNTIDLEDDMDELIKLLSDKVGLTPDKAQMAVQLVLSHIKGKAPALSSQLDSLMSGGATSGLGDVAGKLGGLMGGKE